MKNVVVVIMAGGLGKRMESTLPKVLHKVAGIPMICHLLIKLKVLQNIINIQKIIIIVGKHKDIIKSELDKYEYLPKVEYVLKDEPLGTGHAVTCCINELNEFPDSDVLILSGDVPLLSTQTMNNLINMDEHVRIIVTSLENPTGYGRIIQIDNKFDKIVEQKDCNKMESQVKQVNCGIYVIKSKYLCKYLPYLKNENSQHEYYLTDIIEIIKREVKIDIGMLKIPEVNNYEIIGVNTIDQLNELEKLIIKNKIEIVKSDEEESIK